jgi:hypothetical protein
VPKTRPNPIPWLSTQWTAAKNNNIISGERWRMIG